MEIIVQYTVPESHSEKDYIQLLLFQNGDSNFEYGLVQNIPKGNTTGTLVFKTFGLLIPCVCRFIYVQCGN